MIGFVRFRDTPMLIVALVIACILFSLTIDVWKKIGVFPDAVAYLLFAAILAASIYVAEMICKAARRK